MNKNEWLSIKKSKNYPIEILYEFYQNRRKETEKELTLDEFTIKFMEYFNHVRNVNNTLIDEFFDKKLGITKLFNEKGELLKEY